MRIEIGNPSEVGVLTIFRLTTHLNDCRSESIGRYCAFALSLFSQLKMFAATIAHVRSLIGQNYDHAANMNSESAKELLKLRNSALV